MRQKGRSEGQAGKRGVGDIMQSGRGSKGVEMLGEEEVWEEGGEGRHQVWGRGKEGGRVKGVGRNTCQVKVGGEASGVGGGEYQVRVGRSDRCGAGV